MFNDGQENHIKQTDKTFLGIFLNQARLNAYITLCHISDLLREKTVNENSLSEMPVLNLLEDAKDAVKSQRAFGMIEKHFAMLKIIYESQNKQKNIENNFSERTKSYRQILMCLLKALNYQRNKHCHVYPGKTERKHDEVELIRYLDNCFDASVRRVKDIRSLEEKDVSHLRRFVESKEKGRQATYNPDFHYKFKDEQGQFNEKGLAFLAAMFLEKKDTYLFLKQLTGFKRGETPAEKATLESFCCFRTKMPKPVMASDDDKNGLALDMLNNLQKCPKELFEQLSKENQQEFRIVVDSEDNEENGNEILMRRYSDRFPYLALRYCDENELFKKLRFHVDLGRYYFKFYEKETIDGNTCQRALDKRLKTFGRIKEVKEKVEQEWKDIIKSPEDINEDQNEPYKQKTTPHYHQVDNQIGFVISGDCNLPDIKQPEEKTKLNKPDAWLSIYELPGMIFHGLSYGFEKTEPLIEQYIKRQRKICEEICETGAIPGNAGVFLPEALKDTGTSDAKQSNYAEEKLQRMLKDTINRITAIKTTKKRMDDKSNKPGKKKFFDIRAGKLADFLARDMMALQKFDPDKKGKDKLTSINYQVLQATLAYYGANKGTIADMFKKIGLIGGDNPHPFLNQIDPARYNSIADFYLAYLNTKQKYLEDCEKDGELDGCQFLRPSRQRYAKGNRDIRTIARQLLDNPVNIPKGFFQKQIEEVVCNEDPSLKDRQMNTAYMIQANFEQIYGAQQQFYDYQRTYPVVLSAKEYGKKRENRKILKALNSILPEMGYRDMKAFIEKEIPEQKGYEPEHLRRYLLNGCKDFKNNERLLRRYKIQDMVTFMMAEKTLRNVLKINGATLKPADIHKPGEKTIFDKPIPYDVDITVYFNKRGHEAEYFNFIENNYKDVNYEGNKIILKYTATSESTKLKDVGKYRRYLYDRRLPGLLIWKHRPDDKDKIKFSDIEKQIQSYGQYRKQTAEALHSLESKVLERYVSEGEKGQEHISFNTIIEKLKKNMTGFDGECDTLLRIRNAIYHNQFPVYEDAIEKAYGDTIAERMYSVTKDYVDQILHDITSI